MNSTNEHSDFINFRNYYTGNMSSAEKVAFENKLAKDPFAQEAYEGFLTLDNDFARISAIENTNMLLKDKLGIGTSRSILPLKYVFGIAATLVLFLGSYFVIQSNFSNKNEPIVANQNESTPVSEIIEETQNTSLKVDSFVIDSHSVIITDVEEEIKIDNPIAIIKKPEKEKTKKNIATNKDLVSKSKQISEKDFDKYRNNNETASINNNKTFAPSAKETVASDKRTVSPQLMNSVYAEDNEALFSEKLEEITDYKKGIVAYNKSEYTKAIKSFNAAINSNQSLSGSNYYIGMSYFNQNKSLKALKYFNKTINRGSSFKDNALWYKSLTLIKRGEKIEAKLILNQLANSDSSFKNAAIKKLATL